MYLIFLQGEKGIEGKQGPQGQKGDKGDTGEVSYCSMIKSNTMFFFIQVGEIGPKGGRGQFNGIIHFRKQKFVQK